jgi:DNA repair exonuclease SbcCD ATPase subunit
MNLLSTGNQFTELDLNKHKTTLIMGTNGAGKSTLIEALTFALYGKPFRNINKPQLMNSITQKNLLVEVEFTVGKKDYLVRRGIKPALFEIYQNGVLLNQNAEVKEYQDMFEKTVLKMNYKSFKQIVVLGSSNYVPFMQLSAYDRRQVIEDLLDIQIFSVMNNLLKEKLNQNKSEIRDNEYKIELIDQKIEMTQKHIKSLRSNNEEMIEAKNKLIQELNENIATAEASAQLVYDEIDALTQKLPDVNKLSSKRNKLNEIDTKIRSKISSLKKEINFFHDHDNCPTCKQGIDHEFKTQRIEHRQSQHKELDDAIYKLNGDLDSIEKLMSEASALNTEISKKNAEITSLNSDIRVWNSSINVIHKEIESIKTNTSQIDASIEEMKNHKEQRVTLNNAKVDLYEQKSILDVSSTLLKDGGIKTRIIKQFVPIINKLVNKYLAALDFFVNFELDEQFNETIKSRFRDEFSYASFSEGEKFRIDISLMLTWRAIAKLRNSASTNLLIMDEVFDGSSDLAGVENLVKILDTIGGDSNIFIISHSEKMMDKLEHTIRFEKNGNFSRMVTHEE